MAACLADSIALDRLESRQQLVSEHLAEVTERKVHHLGGLRDRAHGAADLHRWVRYVGYIDLSLVQICARCGTSSLDRALISNELLLVNALPLAAASTEVGRHDLVSFILSPRSAAGEPIVGSLELHLIRTAKIDPVFLDGV